MTKPYNISRNQISFFVIGEPIQVNTENEHFHFFCRVYRQGEILIVDWDLDFNYVACYNSYDGANKMLNALKKANFAKNAKIFPVKNLVDRKNILT